MAQLPAPVRASGTAAFNAYVRMRARVSDAAPSTTPVLVAGTGRSGTTALMSAAAAAFEAAPLFEPLAPHSSLAIRRVVPAHGYPCLSPGDRDNDLRRLWTRAFEGRLWNRWTLGHTTLDSALSSRGVVVKEIRANRMLGWLGAEFPQLETWLLVRNPYDVVDSMLRTQHGWRDLPWEHVVPAAANALGCPVDELPGRASPMASRLAMLWIADNKLALADAVSPRIRIVAYEHLMSRPDDVLSSLIPEPEALRRAAGAWARPSATSSPEFMRGASPRRLTAMTSDDIDSVKTLLDRFGIGLYSSEQGDPVQDLSTPL